MTAAVAERFWASVDKNGPVPAHRPELGPCWVWKGKPNETGYGRVGIEGRVELAHRVAWKLVNGAIPDGLGVLHHCDNRMCQRAERDPAKSHLFLGDRGDNARDMAAKGRAHLQRNPKAFAGDRHWKRRHPERVPRKGTRPCSNCRTPTNPLRRGRCVACSSYFRRHGVERPAHFFTTQEA
jgi:hypothetical protein